MNMLYSIPLLLTASYVTCFNLSVFLETKEIPEDAILNVPQLIEKYKYPVEVHHVESDSYILEMHRIPYGIKEDAGPAKNKPMVFVQHGLLSSSADWIIAGPEKGLGYLLADLGYDVWMGNARGNTYSRKHKTLSPKGRKFWNFSWHEIGIHDLPAMIDYALANSNQTHTYYIGHSQGNTAFYVMCSELPAYNSKIRAQFSLAPVAFMSRLFSPMLRFMAFLKGPLDVFFRIFGEGEFLPQSGFLTSIGDKMCNENSVTQFICTNSLFVLCGFSVEQMNIELLPVIMGHTPAGSSTKQFMHYGQLVNMLIGKFRQYDYFPLNWFQYYSLTPPNYDLSKITAPVALFYSKNDWLASIKDVNKLYKKLPNPINRYLVTNQYFNHLDYLWGRDVDELVYKRIFDIMPDY